MCVCFAAAISDGGGAKLIFCVDILVKLIGLSYRMGEPQLHITYIGAALIHSQHLLFTYNGQDEIYSSYYGVIDLQTILDSKDYSEGQKIILDTMYHALCCQNMYNEDLLLMWHGHLFRVIVTPVHLLSNLNPLPILLERIRAFINELNYRKLPDLSKCCTQRKYGKYCSKFDSSHVPNNTHEKYKFALRSHEIRNFIVAWGCDELHALCGLEDLLEPNLLRLIMQFMR